MFKKINKKYCMLLIILGGLLIFNGCSRSAVNTETKTNPIKKVMDDKIGKYQGNRYGRLEFVKGEDCIYMINHDNIHLYKKEDFSLYKVKNINNITSLDTISKITNENITKDSELNNLNYYNGYLYFTYKDENKNPYICKMKSDGSDFKKIIDLEKTCTHPQYLIIYNDYMYYLDENPKTHSTILCRVGLDGTYHKVIFDNMEVSTGSTVNMLKMFYIYKDNIYIELSQNIYKIKVDGSNPKKIADEKDTNNLIVFKDKIYFTESGDYDQTIYSMNLDGSDEKELNRKASVLNASNDKLYYIYKNVLYKMDVSGSNDKKMFDTLVESSSIVDESTVVSLGDLLQTGPIITTN